MRMKKSSPNNSQKQNNTRNVILEVAEFIDDDPNNVGIKGRDLLTGNEVEAYLTDRGETANNKNRWPVSKFQQGFKMMGAKKKTTLDPGGVVCLKNAFSLNDSNKNIGTWMDVLAYNKEEARENLRMSDGLTLEISKRNTETSNSKYVYYGYAYDIETDPDNLIEAKLDNIDEITDSVTSFAENSNQPCFFVRFLNENNEIEDDMVIKRQVSKDTKSPLSKEDYADNLKRVINEKAKNDNLSADRVSIIPVDRVTISPYMLNTMTKDQQGNDINAGLNYFTAIQKGVTKEHEDGDVEHLAKAAFLKLGGDNQEFVNSIALENQYQDGFDPMLIGGLKYSPSYFMEEQTTQNEAQEEVPQVFEQQSGQQTGEELDNIDFTAGPR